MLEQFKGRDYDFIRERFRWSLPARLNLGAACSNRQPASAAAVIHAPARGEPRRYSFGQLTAMSNALANALRADGVERGDRVAVVLPQGPPTAVAHLAIYKLGAVALPLSTLFGPDALEIRLRDSGTRVAITDQATLPGIETCADRLPGLERLILDRGASSRWPSRTFDDAVAGGSSRLVPVDTSADDPALLIYTSGTTGPPKGALHAHRALLGHLPGFELSHDFFPIEGDLFWTPADWAWIGGLMDALLPTLWHGRPILVADSPGGFDPEYALRAMADHGVRNTFLPPTALKMLRRSEAVIPAALRLRTMMSGGESLGAETLEWAGAKFGVGVNEIFGQTECNYIVGNSSRLYPVRPGSMGRPYPGHQVAIMDDSGEIASSEVEGEVVVRRPDPVMFIGYWNQPEATANKYSGEWLRTGDFAVTDGDGYLSYVGRRDDLISSAGYRIGPTEIESCLLRHPAVAMAAVVGVADPVRGEVVKAFIQARPGAVEDEALAAEIQQFVKSRLAAYQYPRIVEFIAEMPLTTTGKIRRAELRARLPA